MSAPLIPLWPGTLPVYVLRANYGEAPKWAMAEFETEVGPPITRPKGSVDMAELACMMVMDGNQLAILHDFVFYDLARGAKPFLGPHPRTQEQTQLQFNAFPKPYEIKARTGKDYNVSFTLLEVRR